MLLEDIRSVFEAKQRDRLKSFDLVSALIELEGHPWAEWHHTRPLTKHGLARLLVPFGIRPQTIRIGTVTAKGYLKEHFEEAFNRYLAPCSSVTTVTPSQAEDRGVSGLPKPSQ